MSRSHRSVLFVVVILFLVVSILPAAPVGAAGPAASDSVRSASSLDLSVTGWLLDLAERWLGLELAPVGTEAGEETPSRVFDRAGSLLDPDGVEAEGALPEEDGRLVDSEP